MNKWCRSHSVGYIAADIRGLMGVCFVDLGQSFVVADINDEAPVSKLISNVTQGSPGIVTCIEDVRHGLETGDSVIFEEVEGMIELNGSSLLPRKIKVVSPYSFSIEDTSAYNSYTGGGRFRQVVCSFFFNYKSRLNFLLQYLSNH